MSKNLIFSNDNAPDQATENWDAIKTVSSEHGMVFLTEETVNAVGALLDGVRLTNGEKVWCCAYEADEPYAAMVSSFGPALLPAEMLAKLREALGADTQSGDQAVALLDLIVELGLQISLSGKEHCDAHIKGVNWPADEVEISRCDGNLYAMLLQLAVEHDPKAGSGEVSFELFEQAVNDNAWRTDMPERLEAFVACAKRNGATRVYWA